MDMDKLVALCRRRGFLFQSSEIYGGLNGFWDYGPLGVELKRNVKEAWWRDMVSAHNELVKPAGAPSTYEMVGLDCSIIMHPQVWKVSGHYDLFHDMMVDCRQTKRRYRFDQLRGRWLDLSDYKNSTDDDARGIRRRVGAIAARRVASSEEPLKDWRFFVAVESDDNAAGVVASVECACKIFEVRSKHADDLFDWESEDLVVLTPHDDLSMVVAPDATDAGTLTEPREFNLMFKTIVGAMGGEEDAAFLRPETAQGIFVNFKNVTDSTRVQVPFGIAQVGKSFRNEITPRNFTFRSREFEQMEIEFFCHPSNSRQWYEYWRDRRMAWYKGLGLAGDRLRLRDHATDELSHYSIGTADIEYAFPFLRAGRVSASWKGSPIAAISTCAATWKASSIRRRVLLAVRVGRRRQAEAQRQRPRSDVSRRHHERDVSRRT